VATEADAARERVLAARSDLALEIERLEASLRDRTEHLATEDPDETAERAVGRIVNEKMGEVRPMGVTEARVRELETELGSLKAKPGGPPPPAPGGTT